MSASRFQERQRWLEIDSSIALACLEVRGSGVFEVPPTRHDDWFELDITPDRRASIIIEGTKTQSSNDQLLLIHPGRTHRIEVEVAGIFRGFSLFIARNLLEPCEHHAAFSHVLDERQQIQRLFEAISDSLLDEEKFDSTLVVEVLKAVAREIRRRTVLVNLPGNFRQVIETIRQRYAEPLSIDELAKAASVSKYHFTRRFRALLGVTPMEYLNDIRLEQAGQMLRAGPDRNIAEIAYDVGFNDMSVFNRRFKKRFLTSPKKYRQQWSNQEP